MSDIKLLDQQLTIIDDDGNETLCQILFTFESEEFNKNYVLFYPVESTDDSDDVAVMAASYTEEDGGVGELHEIETEEEWELIEEVLRSYEDTLEDDDDAEYDDDDECEECGCDECECEEEDDDCECHHHHHDDEE